MQRRARHARRHNEEAFLSLALRGFKRVLFAELFVGAIVCTNLRKQNNVDEIRAHGPEKKREGGLGIEKPSQVKPQSSLTIIRRLRVLSMPWPWRGCRPR